MLAKSSLSSEKGFVPPCLEDDQWIMSWFLDITCIILNQDSWQVKRMIAISGSVPIHRLYPVDNLFFFFFQFNLQVFQNERKWLNMKAQGVCRPLLWKLCRDLCSVEPTIFILIKNLSLQGELWRRSLENSWQCYEFNTGHQNEIDINNKGPHKSI